MHASVQTCLPCATLDWPSPRGAANDSVSPFELGVCACPGTTASGPCCPSELLKEPPRLSRLAVLRAVWMQVPTKERPCSRECDDVGAVPHIERPVDAAVRRRAAAGDPRCGKLRCSAPQGPASRRATDLLNSRQRTPRPGQRCGRRSDRDDPRSPDRRLGQRRGVRPSEIRHLDHRQHDGTQCDAFATQAFA